MLIIIIEAISTVLLFLLVCAVIMLIGFMFYCYKHEKKKHSYFIDQHHLQHAQDELERLAILWGVVDK